MALCWGRVDLERWLLRVEETKTGEPLELPITRQLAALLECGAQTTRRSDAQARERRPLVGTARRRRAAGRTPSSEVVPSRRESQRSA